MRYRNSISSVQLRNRKDRIVPFGIASFFYLLTYLLLKKLTIPAVIIDMYFGLAISVFAVFFITLKFKISAHMTGISGLIGAFFGFQLLFGADLSLWLVLLVLVWGLIGSARLTLAAHSNAELVSGTALGFFTIVVALFMGWG